MDMFATLEDLETNFRNHDTDAIRSNIDEISDGVNDVASAGADLGNISNRLDFLFQQYEGSMLSTQQEISSLVDADYAKVLSNIQKYEISYRAALNASSRLLQNSLVNYI
jgi:flagellar hook-associated protein 3 FlgL